MYACYIEYRSDQFNSLVQPSKEIPFRFVQFQLSRREDFRPDLVFQPMDFDTVCEMGDTGLGGGVEERDAHWDEEEGKRAGAEGRIACAGEGEGNIAVGCAGEPLETFESVYRTVWAQYTSVCGDCFCLGNIRASGSLQVLKRLDVLKGVDEQEGDILLSSIGRP